MFTDRNACRVYTAAGYEDPSSSVADDVSNPDTGYVDLYATEDNEMGDGDGNDIEDSLDEGYTLDTSISADGSSQSMAPHAVIPKDSIMLDGEWGEDAASESPLTSSETEGEFRYPANKRKRLSFSVADKPVQNTEVSGVSLGRRATRSLHAASRKNG